MPLEYGKRVFPLRFVTRAVKNVMGIYGFSAPPEITVLDSDMSDQLSKAGLRTRALVYTAPFGPDVIFATDQKHQDQSESPNGKLVKTPSITKALGYTPGLEIWAIRCRYRLRDLLTNNNLLARVIGSGARNIVDYSNGYQPKSEPYHVRLKNHVVDRNRDSTDLYRDFDFLGGELLTRMSLDQDKRFTEIYDLFGKKVTEENRQRFWEEYTNKFSEILGEQIGILYSKGVFSRGGLMNPQNITLLAEIVDMDAMQVDINLKNDGPSVLNQLQLAIEPLADMLSKLYATGMFPEKIDMYGILRKFARGLLAKLSTEDKELITTVIEVERNKAMQSSKSEYETLAILHRNQSRLSSQDLLEKNQEQIELIEKSIVHSIIPLRQDQKFALAIDVTGDAAVSTVVDMLLAA
jgi:hypothetical protein